MLALTFVHAAFPLHSLIKCAAAQYSKYALLCEWVVGVIGMCRNSLYACKCSKDLYNTGNVCSEIIQLNILWYNCLENLFKF